MILKYLGNEFEGGVLLKIFLVTDGNFRDPELDLAILTRDVPPRVNIANVDVKSEMFILENWKPYFHKETKQMVVIDLQLFPYIRTFIDFRNQREVLNSEILANKPSFANDVVTLWETYREGFEIPLIITNINIGFCGIKKIRLDY